MDMCGPVSPQGALNLRDGQTHPQRGADDPDQLHGHISHKPVGAGSEGIVWLCRVGCGWLEGKFSRA